MILRSCFTVLVLGLVLASCSKEFASQPYANQTPETYLFLERDIALRRTTSQQHLRWWGVDQDGFVRGFVFSFDSVSWHFTAHNDSVFSLNLNAQDTTYRFFVAALDNQGNGRYDDITRWGFSEPFTAQDGDARYDLDEPFIDLGEVDPSPAALIVPIKNTPPNVSFLLKSDVPETTFTVATFQWVATDLDGDNTISAIAYALDDTTVPEKWHGIPGSLTTLTLFRNRVITSQDPLSYRNDSLTEGNHVLYLKARDVAGAYSRTIRMPDTSKTWYVKVPRSDFLIVDDYLTTDGAPQMYAALFDTLLAGRFHFGEIFDMKYGSTSIKRGNYVPPLINPTLLETFKLFRYIFWYSDNAPSVDVAISTLPDFLKAGGKILWTTGFPENETDQSNLSAFVPIDNIEPSAFATRLISRDSVRAVAGVSYPVLIRDTLGSFYSRPRGLLPKTSTRILYRMQPTTRWVGEPIVGVKDADDPSVVFLSIVLHRFGTPPNNVAALLSKVFGEEFNVQ